MSVAADQHTATTSTKQRGRPLGSPNKLQDSQLSTPRDNADGDSSVKSAKRPTKKSFGKARRTSSGRREPGWLLRNVSEILLENPGLLVSEISQALLHKTGEVVPTARLTSFLTKSGDAKLLVRDVSGGPRLTRWHVPSQPAGASSSSQTIAALPQVNYDDARRAVPPEQAGINGSEPLDSDLTDANTDDNGVREPASSPRQEMTHEYSASPSSPRGKSSGGGAKSRGYLL